MDLNSIFERESLNVYEPDKLDRKDEKSDLLIVGENRDFSAQKMQTEKNREKAKKIDSKETENDECDPFASLCQELENNLQFT